MSKRKLLLADDSMTIQKVVNLTFADEEIEVITAGDGDSAMEKFAENMPDLVLADVNMPGLNGYQICKEIKQNEPTKNIPVILLVGSFEPFDEEEARRVGADDFMTKPFQSIRQLINKVSNLINSDRNSENGAAGETNSAKTNEDMETVNAASAQAFDSDSAIDDETIQAGQIESMPTDAAPKFETAFVDEPPEEDFEQNRPDADAIFRNLEDYEPSKTYSSETQPLTAEDFTEIASSETKEAELPDEKPVEFSDERNLSEDNSRIESKPSSSSLQFDETNLLEIPRLENSFSASNFPPELIEAVTDKVVEKLSDRAVREIAREIVPQMAELIIRQMAREKFKD